MPPIVYRLQLPERGPDDVQRDRVKPWLRGWYDRALENPEVEVTRDGVTTARVAVPVAGAERDRLADAYRMGFVLRFVCGFAPSRFL